MLLLLDRLHRGMQRGRVQTELAKEPRDAGSIVGRPSLYPRIMGPAGRVVRRGRGEGKEGRREGRGGGGQYSYDAGTAPEPRRNRRI